jgi:hypothetical protein
MGAKTPKYHVVTARAKWVQGNYLAEDLHGHMAQFCAA